MESFIAYIAAFLLIVHILEFVATLQLFWREKKKKSTNMTETDRQLFLLD